MRDHALGFLPWPKVQRLWILGPFIEPPVKVQFTSSEDQKDVPKIEWISVYNPAEAVWGTIPTQGLSSNQSHGWIFPFPSHSYTEECHDILKEYKTAAGSKGSYGHQLVAEFTSKPWLGMFILYTIHVYTIYIYVLSVYSCKYVYTHIWYAKPTYSKPQYITTW